MRATKGTPKTHYDNSISDVLKARCKSQIMFEELPLSKMGQIVHVILSL